jgi:hypothetical protein
MAKFMTRWRLVLGTLAVVLAWGTVAPNSLLLVLGLLSAFGFVIAGIQQVLESPPTRAR